MYKKLSPGYPDNWGMIPKQGGTMLESLYPTYKEQEVFTMK